MNTRAQAAMEFLMTYGWAILVVLVAIGALAYFGVLNPGRFLPSSCTVGPGIGCDDFKVEATQLTLVLRNGLGASLTNVGVNVGTCITQDPGANGNDAWVDGEVLNQTMNGKIVLTGCTNGAIGSRFKKDLNLYYTASGLAHNVTGSLTARVE